MRSRQIVLILYTSLTMLEATCCSVDQDPQKKPQVPMSAHEHAIAADPMSFLLYYLKDFESILNNKEKDCKNKLIYMMRFITLHKATFTEMIKDRPSANSMLGKASRSHIELWMEFAMKCPRQLARFNRSVHALASHPPPDK